jgi:eukaryotic-like serine/threonine-protein kinase
LDLAPGLVIADRFRLERVLGQGGMGSVWLAQQIALDVPCAVKFIHAEAARSPELRARFEREAKAAAQLRSPYVVQILDHGVWQDAPYIAMELLDGEGLDTRLKRRGKLSPQEAMGVALHVGRALTKAHAAGLVHRDLKPANIFLVRDDEREIAKVLDFGVAKTTAMGLDGNTMTGAVLGTPFYMSPEQARGQRGLDHRSDLWALAVVVYRCVTGQLPFRSDVLGDLFAKIISDPIPRPSAVAPVPPGFDAWWARAAARDPAQRFQTAKELTDALGLALGTTATDTIEVGMATPMPATYPPAALDPSSTDGGTIVLPQGPGLRPGLRSHDPSAAPGPGSVTPSPYVAPVPPAAPMPPTPARNRVLPVALAALTLVALGVGGGVYALNRAPSPGAAASAPAAPQPTAIAAPPAPPAPPPPSALPAVDPPVAPASAAPPAPVASASAHAPSAAASTSRPRPAARPATRKADEFGF